MCAIRQLDKTKRTILIVSPYFPPSTLAGVHRARHLAKHLPAHGWNPKILCVHEDFHEHRLDPGLARLVPDSIEITKVAAFPLRYSRPIGIGEISLRAWYSLRRAISMILEQGGADVVLITGSPYYPMLWSSWIRTRFCVPVVLDFQDPWVSEWGRMQPVFSKSGLVHQLAEFLEPRAVRHSDFVTTVSDTQNEAFAARYTWFDRARIATIPIGGDPEDFDAIRRSALGGLHNERHAADRQSIRNFHYVGTYWERAFLAVRTLFRALRKLRETEPASAAKVRLNFVGTNYHPTSDAKPLVKGIAEAEGVGDLVVERPRRLPYLEALQVMAGSDGLILLGSDEPHYTASKIYPALMTGRPYLSLFHAKSSAHEILSAAGGGLAFGFTEEADLQATEARIAAGFRTLSEAPETLGRADSSAYASFTAHAIAGKFANILNNLTGCPPCGPVTRPDRVSTQC